MRLLRVGVVCVIAVSLMGCGGHKPFVSPLQSLSALATPTPRLVGSPPYMTATPTVRPRPSPTAPPSPSPMPSATPTYPSYTDAPFTVVFIRDGNLWLAEIGKGRERQLTTETLNYPILAPFAIAPDCRRIAYTPYNSETRDALIKQVDLTSGVQSVLTGQDDPFSEYGVQWLDAAHIAFRIYEGPVLGYDKTAWNIADPFNHAEFDLTTGQRTWVPESLCLSQSRDGRYQLTCDGYPYGETWTWVLHDLTTKDEFPTAQQVKWGGFLGWSPDSQQMLFETHDNPNDPTIQLVIIDVDTRKELTMTTNDKTIAAASWSPDSQIIAFTQCDVENEGIRKNCALRLMNRDGNHLRSVPLENVGEAVQLDWTPDGSRLLFTISNEGTFEGTVLWSVRLDGTDLRPVVFRGHRFQVLCPSQE